MADTRQINEEYTKIGAELIETEEALANLRGMPYTIIYLSSSHKKKSKGNLIFGQCEKVSEKNKWAIPCDFTITVFEPNCVGMSNEQIRTLIFHELLHVGADKDEPYIRPHDLEDFRYIIRKFGVDWSKTAAGDEENECREILTDSQNTEVQD